MRIPKHEYDEVCLYIAGIAVNPGAKVNRERLKTCMWIVEQVYAGAVTVEPE